MARIRTIKPEFPHSESMGKVSRDARLTFIELWTLADDSGRLRGNSRMLASLLFPYDDDAPGLIETWLGELERERCIVRYSSDGTSCLQVCNWLNHQKIDKPSPSKLPEFVESSRIVARPRELSSGDQGSRIKDQGPGSRIKDQGSERQLSDDAPDDAQLVFDHWRQTHNHPQSAFDMKRRRLVLKCLKQYSAATLCQSISGYLNSPHHMGQNKNDTRYDSLELLLRDGNHIDAGLKFHVEPPRADLSDKTRRIIDQTESWSPPEVRNASH